MATERTALLSEDKRKYEYVLILTRHDMIIKSEILRIMMKRWRGHCPGLSPPWCTVSTVTGGASLSAVTTWSRQGSVFSTEIRIQHTQEKAP